MAGSIIGAGVGAAASIFGGIQASKAAKKMKENVEEQRQKNQDWYDQRYNEDATQRADAQAVLTQTRDAIRSQNRAAAGTAAVMGGTDESVASQKAATNTALSQTMSNINAQADQRKDSIESQYMANDNSYVQQLNEIEQNKANAIQQAAQGVASAAGGLSGTGSNISAWDKA